MDGAGSALADSATILGAGEVEDVSKHPEEGHVGRDIDGGSPSIHVQFIGHIVYSGSLPAYSRRGERANTIFIFVWPLVE
jgi:hypothetical protein